MGRLSNWLPNLWAHPLSLIGTVLTTVTGFALLFALAVEFSASGSNAYATGFLMLVLPALFVLGLLLIALGVWFAHRRRARGGEVPPLGERVGSLFATKAGRRKLLLVGLLTAVNVVLVGAAGAHAIHWMDSPSFCGTACHTVMQPEWETYRESPHARVACVQCHIGPGASFLIRSKVDGLRQVWRTITDTYDRPVPVPVHTLRPSRDTCEQCHWPDKFHGNPVTHLTHVLPDETNTREANVFLLKLGGRNEVTGAYEGIHWHVSRDFEVLYDAWDEKRERIGKITVREGGKVLREYLPPAGAEGAAAPAVVETRTMDCIDCHNRPTHVFDVTPARALDRGFALGRLDPGVKWLRALAEPILARSDFTRDGADAAIRSALEAAYRAEHPDALPAPPALDAAAKALADLWRANNYPERAVTWRTYPSHLGHSSETPDRHGCWRCHDEKHKTADGRALSKDCELCHEMLAQEEKLEDLDDSLKTLLQTR